MPTVLKLSWDKKNKCWRKMINGKRYNLGAGKSKSDLQSYRRAYARYEQLLYDLEKTQREPVTSFSQIAPASDHYEQMTISYAKKFGGEGLRSTDTILGLIDRFIYDQQLLTEHKPRKLSPKTIDRYRMGFEHPKYGIIKFLGTRTVGKAGSASNLERTPSRRRILEHYHNQLSKWMAQKKSPLSPEYANLFYATIKKWYLYLWEKEHIRELPRVIFRLKPFELPPNKKNANNFTVEQIRHLYKMAYGHNSKLWSNTMRCWLLLGTNCAFGPHEVATLTIEEIDFEKGRIRRFREKTKIYAEWKLWPETLHYLKICLDLNPKPLFYSDHFDAIPQKEGHHLLFKSQQNNPLQHSRFTAHGSKNICSINKRFLNLRRKWLEDEHIGNGFKSLRRLSASLVDDLELNDHARVLGLLLGHMVRGSVAYKAYVNPSFKELDSALDQLREVYGFYKIEDQGKGDYKKRYKLSTHVTGRGRPGDNLWGRKESKEEA